MILAITGQWVAEVTGVLCLFGAACIGLAIQMADGRGRTSDDGDQIARPPKSDSDT
jgi:hypothetical protein